VSTILVIEQEELIRGLIRVILESAGYNVVEAGKGEAGFQLAREGGIDGVVLDCMGYRSDGIGVLRRLRGDATTAHLPVIALCGLGQSGAEVGLWANSLVVKPFRPQQLLLKVEMTMSARIEAARQAQMSRPIASA
jgi:two-component system cell cycle response regulator DivK